MPACLGEQAATSAAFSRSCGAAEAVPHASASCCTAALRRRGRLPPPADAAPSLKPCTLRRCLFPLHNQSIYCTNQLINQSFNPSIYQPTSPPINKCCREDPTRCYAKCKGKQVCMEYLWDAAQIQRVINEYTGGWGPCGTHLVLWQWLCNEWRMGESEAGAVCLACAALPRQYAHPFGPPAATCPPPPPPTHTHTPHPPTHPPHPPHPTPPARPPGPPLARVQCSPLCATPGHGPSLLGCTSTSTGCGTSARTRFPCLRRHRPRTEQSAWSRERGRRHDVS